jgi:hypothetical protein
MSPIRLFDALEARTVLSAPVASVQSFALTADTMTLVVAYDADTGIDPSSIDTYDLGVTGPGVSRYSESATIIDTQGTRTRVQYVLRSGPAGTDHDLWPNGAFILGTPPGVVRSHDGEVNAETGAGAYWLWYTDTFIELKSMAIVGEGWSLGLTLWMRHPDAQTPVTASAQIVGPGSDQTFQTQGLYSRHSSSVTLQAENAGGLWDYTDTGAYSISLGNYQGTQVVSYRPTAQYWLWFSSPKVEILSTAFTDSSMSLTARFSDDQGMDLTSFDWTNFVVYAWAYPVHPVSAPQVDLGADGSVTATYSYSMFRGWTNRESGIWSYYNMGRVRDAAGNLTQAGIVRRESHTFTTLYTADPTLWTTPDNSWSATASFRFSPGDVDLSNFGDGSARLDLNGRSYPMRLDWLNTGGRDDWGQPIYQAQFSLSLPSPERLTSGLASVYLNAGAVSVAGSPNADLLLGTWNVTFW